MDTLLEGWGFPRGSSKAHYMTPKGVPDPTPESFKTSLCGRYGFYRAEVEADDKPSPDDCAQCRKRLAKHQAASVRAQEVGE